MTSLPKGAVIEKSDLAIQIYPKLTILDESGLVIIARQVPNLFYQYRGEGRDQPQYLYHHQECPVGLSPKVTSGMATWWKVTSWLMPINL